MSSSTALTKRPSDTDLMPPPPPPKRIKRPPKVLDEDTYTDALSHIIARDFFPGLLETETQQEYLDALDAGDTDWIEEAGQRVRAAMTPGRRGRRGVNMTPLRREGFAMETPRDWRGETPGSVRSNATPSRSQNGEVENPHEAKTAVDLNLGLTAFQAKYTSEDNESFNKVLDTQNEKRAEKYRWMWNGNKLASKRQLAQAAVQQKRLQSGPSEDDSNNTQALILQPQPSQDLDLRPAMINQLPSSGPRNHFMFTPSDLSETHPHLPSVAQEAQAASSAPPKAVAYSNTRLPTALIPSDDTDTIPQSPSLSAIDAAILGRPRHRAESTIAPGSETPRVNGYAFVDAEPTPSELGLPTSPPTPHQDNDLLQQLILSSSGDGASTGPNPFTIRESSARESLHHRMVERTLAAKRTSNGGGSRLSQLHQTPSTSTPKFVSSPRITRAWEGGKTPVVGGIGRVKGAGLTPAGRDLYSKIGKTPRAGDGQVFGAVREKEKGGWTPTPLRVRRAA